MADLLSSWCHEVKAVPQSHIAPLHERPLDLVPIVKEIPVIDLGKAMGEERAVVIEQLMKAWENYGCFQVINHGVPENLMEDAMKVYQEFFNLPVEDKAGYAKAAANNSRKGGSTVYSGSGKHYDSEGYREWRDVLEHSCNNEEDMKTWPDNPQRFRVVIGSYSSELKKLSKIILALVSEGLGLEAGYFDKELGHGMLGNHYPACPDPTSTLGVGGHCDPNLITLLQQEVYGLQLWKDEKWIGVEPIRNAFVVTVGLAMTVISNGKLASVAHRVVTNTAQARTSIGTFICPQDVVEPAKSLVGPSSPPLYTSFNFFTEFMPHYFSKRSVANACLEPCLEPFKIDA